MKSGYLPDHGKGQLLVSLGQISTTNSNELQLEFLGSLDGGVVINILTEIVLWRLVNLLPLNDRVINFIDNLVHQETVFHILIEIVYVDVFDTQGVDPQSESSLLSRSLNVIIKHLGSLVLVFGQILETMLGVEDIRDEEGIDLNVGLDDIRALNNVWNAKSEGIGDHLVST